MTPVRRRLARGAALGVLVLAGVCVIASGVLSVRMSDRVPEGRIVVVGDPSTEQMQAVLSELEERVSEGDPLLTTGGELELGTGIVIFVLLLWIAVGVFIVWRQPANWAGWLFIIIGAPLPVQSLGQVLVVYGLKVEPGSVPLLGLFVTIGEFALYPLALLPLLFLLYPDGHLPSRRWRVATAGLAGGTGVALLAFLLRPGPFNNWRDDGILYENPLGIDGFGFAGAVIGVGTIVALLSALSTVVAVRSRFRRSTGSDRQQVRVLVFVASVAALFFATQLLLIPVFEFFGSDDSFPIFNILFGLTVFTLVLGIPAAYVVAILKYRLWDLDVVIRKAVVFGVLAGFISIVYAGIVAGLGALVGSRFDTTLAFAAAAALALLFQPVRERARHLADRFVYGRRATPYEVLSEFSNRVGGSYAADDVLPRMAQIVAEGTGADGATVWLHVGAELRPEASWPGVRARASAPVAGDDLPDLGEDAVEVRHLTELLGAISLSMPPNDPMNPSKERLVRDLASQAGLVLRNARLIQELRASRQRLVAAQDEERRRIERNLHDGAQQQLVALSVQLRLAEQLTGRDPDKERELLQGLQAAANQALDDLRDLARGIYPPLLADKGLPAAIAAQARRAPMPVEVDPDGVGRYAREIESVAYFCTLEALNNVAKYADASRTTVRLMQQGDELVFEVTDDGAGFDPASTGYGTGLQGMADRLDAIGGRLDVRSSPGRGSTVTGRIPVRAEVTA